MSKFNNSLKNKIKNLYKRYRTINYLIYITIAVLTLALVVSVIMNVRQKTKLEVFGENEKKLQKEFEEKEKQEKGRDGTVRTQK